MPRKTSTTFTQYRSNVSADELEVLARKLEEDPENFDLMDWAAFAFYSHGQCERARDTYTKLLARFPENPSYHYYLANTLYQLGEVEQATEYWRRTIGLDSEGAYSDRAKRKIQNLRSKP